MDSVAHVDVPLRGGKKMKKRKELDALVAHTINKRSTEVKRSSSAGGVSSHDQLLSDSTDEQDYWTSSAGGKSLRCHRRRYLVRKRTCSAFLRACSAILVFTCVVATTTVMWLFIDVREQVSSLRTELSTVVAGSQGVPDALQKCHSLSRDVQKNQTQIMNSLSGFSFLLNNFSLELTEVKNGLHTVQEQLKASPDLVENPRIIKGLSDSVASFGSEIKDLSSTASTLKDQNNKLDSAVKSLVTNVTEMKVKLTELSNIHNEKSKENDFALQRDAILESVKQISTNLSSINDTLSNKLQWTASEQSKHRKSIEELQEMNQNVTARVKTLEITCTKPAERSFSLSSVGNSSSGNSETKPKPTPLPLPNSSSADSPTTSQFSTNREEEANKSQVPP